MLDGIGAQTITGLIVTILTGKATPLDCYVGLGYSTDGDVELSQPIGALGCEYDIEDIRLFVEHLSSPADGGDYPGMNHAGIKVLIPSKSMTAYVGMSLEAGSPLVDMENPLGILGVETNGDVRFYVEHVNSVFSPGDGITHGGVKFVF